MTYMTQFNSDYNKGAKVWIVINNTIVEVVLLSKTYPAGVWEVEYWKCSDQKVITCRHEKYFSKTMNECIEFVKERGVYINEQTD